MAGRSPSKNLHLGLVVLLLLGLVSLLAPTDLIEVRGRLMRGLVGSYATTGCTCNAPYLGTGGQSFGDPVDVASGAFQTNEILAQLPGRIPITLGWQMQSQNATEGPLGVGTTLSTQFLIRKWNGNPNRFELRTPGHRHFVFDTQVTYPSGYSYYKCTTDPELLGATLTVDNSPNAATKYYLKWKSGATFEFANYGVLRKIVDRFGNFVQIGYTNALVPYYPTSLQQWTNGVSQGSVTLQYYQNSFGPNDDHGSFDGLLEKVTIKGSSYPTKTWSFVYNLNRTLYSVTDPMGVSTGYGWTQYTRNDGQTLPLILGISRNGVNRIWNQYDSQGRVIKQTFPDNGYITASYPPAPGQSGTTTVTDSRGNVTKYEFTWNQATPGYSINKIIDPLGRATTFTRGGSTRLVTSITDDQNRTAQFNWDHATGNLLSVTSPTATGGTVTTQATYDSKWHRVTSVTDPLNRVWQATVDYNTGNVTAVTDARNQTTTFAWDTDGDLLSVTDPTSRKVTYTHGANGQVLTATNLRNEQSVFTYDSFWRLIAVQDANGKRAEATYNAMDQVTSVKQFRGTASATTSFTYNNEGDLTQILDAAGRTWSWGYDSMGRVTRATNPLNQSTLVTWDANGNPTSKTDHLGQKAVYSFGTGDRLTGVTYKRANGTVESTITLNYDATTHLLSSLVDSVGGSYTYTRDPLGRVTAEAGPHGTVSWALDNLGRRTSLQVPGQGTVTYGYSPTDQLSSITQNGLTAFFVYDGAGRRTQDNLPNGVSVNRVYDNAGRLQTLTAVRSGTTLDSHSYTRDGVGNITQHTANGSTWTYGYDDLYRLTSATGPGAAYSWTYDWLGNRLSQTLNGTTTGYTYDVANRMTAVNGAPVGLDANGRVTSYGNDTYGWDVRGRLTSLTRPNLTATFGYDVAGRRTAKTVNGAGTSFLYDGQNLVSEITGSGTAQTLHGTGIDTPLARNGEYFTTDHQRSVRTVTNGSGSVVRSYQYGPFGESGANGTTSPYQYTGRENDGTGLYFYRARYYAPEWGRFMSPDPAGLAAGVNLYAYVGNNPVNLRDPSGLSPIYDDDGSPAFDNLYSSRMSLVEPDGVRLAMNTFEGTFGALMPGYDLITGAAGYNVFGCRLSTGERVARTITGVISVAPALGSIGDIGTLTRVGRTSCFPAGTLIITDRGQKPIEKIKAGDEVLSADPASGEQSYQAVVRTFKRQADELFTITMEDGHVIEATGEHPFWVEGKGFVAARRLARSDLLRDASGHSVRVARTSSRKGEFIVYNFEVENTHTYYAGGLWVHNNCDPLHHVFPQFQRSWFAGRGIDIDHFTVQLPREWHKVLHGGGRGSGRGGWWNSEWKRFRDANPNATHDEIWSKVMEMMEEFGLENLPFQHYKQ
ncbi:MAG: RHS repeat-associated core domain-containing protein [Armatimonadota bacterium]